MARTIVTQEKEKQVQKKKQGKLTKRLIEITKQRSKYWFAECLLCYRILEVDKEWQKLGYASVREYIEAELMPKTDLNYYSFMRKAKMGECIEVYNFPEKELLEIGSSKFRYLSSLLLMKNFDPSGVDGVLNKAKTLPIDVFRDEVVKEKAKIKNPEEAEKVMPQRLAFKLIPDQLNVVSEAFSIAKELSGIEDTNQLLVYICSDFVMNHATGEAAAQLTEQVKEIEASHLVSKVRKYDAEHRYSGRRMKK